MISNGLLFDTHPYPVLLLNYQQTFSTQTPLIQLAHILHLVQGKLYGAALALGE